MYGSETDYQERRYIRGVNTKIPTCAVDHVETEQNGCRPRITALDRAIVIMRIVNWISTETIRPSMVSFDCSYFACTVFDLIGRQHR